MADLRALRSDFPILQTAVGPHARPLVYLDNAATTQKPQAVIDAIGGYYRHSNANVHRGIHTLGERATGLYEAARARVRRFLNARSDREIVFTRGTTESINLVASSLSRLFQPGDEIVLTEMEHHANLVPWFLSAESNRLVLRIWKVTDEGTLDLADLQNLLGPRTRLVAVTWMSNVLGTINPIPDIVAAAHRRGALVLVDGAQGVPHLETDVQALGVDFLAFSAHKMCGPMGIGVLYGREELLERMPPYQGGGEMIRTVRLDGFEPNDLPYKFEAGTPNVEGAVGLSAAIDYLGRVGMDRIRAHDTELVERTLEGLSAIPGLTVLGPKTGRGGLVAFTLDDLHAHDVAAYLDRYGIAVRAGHHCAHPLARRFGVVSTVRASYYFYNTAEEVDFLVETLHRAVKDL